MYDLPLAAMTVWMEASGEPDVAQRGICHVLVNRLRDGRWGKTLAAVCLYPFQFSSWNASDPNRKRMALTPDIDQTLNKIECFLNGAIMGTDTDPTNGALWYFNPTVAKPSWAVDYVKTVDLGQQSFYKEPAKVSDGGQ